MSRRRLFSINNLAHFQNAFDQHIVVCAKLLNLTNGFGDLGEYEPIPIVQTGGLSDFSIMEYPLKIASANSNDRQILRELRLFCYNQIVAVDFGFDFRTVFKNDCCGFHTNSFPKSS